MNQKILINNTESIFTYYGESLDLMNPPDISNFKMYNLYHIFMNNVLCIYKTNKSNKNIPIFWTIINNTEKLDRIPHPNSTLRRLDNNESYFIKLIDNADLPIEIPQPIDINAISCLNPDDSCKNNEQNVCCSTPSIIGQTFRKIQLTDSYFSNITVPLSGLLPNKKYFYKIDNNFSNWPAKIHPYSGFLERSGPTNDQLELTANLEFVFSYLAEEDVGNILVTTSTDDTSNIFTFLTLSLWQEGCDDKTLLSDTINISCKNCLTSLPIFDSLNLDEYSIQSVGDCATIKFDNNNIVTTENTTALKLFYQDIDISKTYSYTISSKDANWPLSISSNSGMLIPKEIYSSGNKLYGSGTIDLKLNFSDTYEEPYVGWSNLNYILDENFNLKLIKENIYANLEAKILTNNCSNTDKAMIFCDNCLEDNEYDCIKNLTVNINNTNESYYPLDVQRPGAEFQIDIECCTQDINLDISLINVCPEQEYLFKIDSYPSIDILPNSGSFFSSSNTFEIKALANLENTSATNIKCTIEHKNSSYSVSDSIILRCRHCEWQQVKILNEIYFPKNYDDSYYNKNLVTGKQDGSLIYAAIPSGYLYRSTDYGINWSPLTDFGKNLWSSIAFSEDTNILFMTGGKYTTPGFLKTVNSLTTNEINTLSSSLPYHGLDISDNGQFITYIRATSSSQQQVYYSEDYGANYSNIVIPNSNFFYASETSITNDGQKIAIGTSRKPTVSTIINAPIYIKSGSSSIRTIFISGETSVSRSAKYSKDGSTLISYVNTPTTIIYTSKTDGYTWDATSFTTKQVIINNSIISRDGSVIVLCTNSSVIFKSTDYGQNWNWFYVDPVKTNAGLNLFSWNNNTSFLSINRYNDQYSINLYKCPLN